MSKLNGVPLRHFDVTVLLLVVGFSAVPEHRVVAQDSLDTLRLYSPHDLIARLDPNGFLFNPAWLNGPQSPPDIGKLCRFRVATGELEERTLLITKRGALSCLSGYEDSVVTLNEAGSTLGLGFVCATNSQIGTVRGHINWFPVTATGLLRWVNYAGGAGADNDLSFSFLTPTPNAVTRGNDDWGGSPNSKAYHIELNYSESLYRLGKKGQSWWNALNGVLKKRDAMARLVNDRLSIVTGLFGLDGVHKFQAELHPIFAMAVLIDTLRTGPHRLREEWAVMVRSRGNLGDCSTGAIPLVTSSDSIQQFVMDLGRWPGAGAPRLTLGPSWTTDSTNPPRARLDSSHLFVGFRYPHPGPVARDFLFLGTIYVEWAAEGSGTPLNRFEPWLPAGTLRQVKLAAVQPETLLARRAQELPVGHPGREVLQTAAEQIDTLSRVDVLGQPPLDSIDAEWHSADTPRAETTVQFPVPKRVGRTCPVKHDPICRGPIRILAMGTWGLRGPDAPPLGASVGVYALSQGLDWLPDPLKAIGYRLDGRLHDRFHRSCDTGCTHRTVEGWSGRLSGILAPNMFPLGHFGTVTTYFIGGVGVFRTHQHTTLFEWQAGFGGYLYNRYAVGVFAEVVNYNTAGGLGNHWVLNFGSVF